MWIADHTTDLESIHNEQGQILEAMVDGDLTDAKAHLKTFEREYDQLLSEWPSHAFAGGKVVKVETLFKNVAQDVTDFANGISHGSLREMKAAWRAYGVHMQKLQGELELLAWLNDQ
jgi:hypothetical protein